MPVLKSYYQSLYQCPIVELGGYCRKYKLPGTIYAYLDFGGATGTAKDGMAEMLLAVALEHKQLRLGQPVVEASGGSFGKALAVACAALGCPCILVVSPRLPEERSKELTELNAKLITAPEGGISVQVRCAGQVAQKCGGYFMNYFYNPENVNYHKHVTGPAILKTMGEGLDAIVAGVGSGGTITGVGEYVREWQGFTRIVAVEPAESRALSGGYCGGHGIEGIGCGFVPELYNPYVVDNVLSVSTGQAKQAALEILLSDGIPACTSAGAVLAAARQLVETRKAERPVCIFSGRK